MSSPRGAKQRGQVVEIVREQLGPAEEVVAVLPFAATPKRPKGPGGKVRVGVYTSYRQYRPLAITGRRLFVLHAGRTPFPRGVLRAFPLGEVEFVDVEAARFGQSRLRLELPGEGVVPFILGRIDAEELTSFRAALGPA
jgi:hypothetical protein